MKKARYIAKVYTSENKEFNGEFFNEPENTGTPLQIVLDRSPDFWKALKVEGEESFIVTIYDNLEEQTAAALICSLKNVWINGRYIKLGYTGSLKVKNAYRRGVVTVRLFKAFQEYSEQHEINCYLFSVFTDNLNALAFFNRKSKLTPIMKPIHQSSTFMFKRCLIKEQKKNVNGLTVQRASKSDVGDIKAFMKKEGAIRAFVPDYSSEDLAEEKGLLQGFKIDDLYLAKNNNGICGMMGTWDQCAHRRWKVSSYSRTLAFFRPLINPLLNLFKMPMLPKTGEALPYRIFSLVLVENDNKAVFAQLFNTIMNQSEDLLFSISLLNNSPFYDFFKKHRIQFNNTLYIGHWPHHEAELSALNFNNPYIEQGAM